MIVLVGESASGKSSIERELIALGFNKIVTYTTRPMRKEDVDGETYHFITEEQFNDMIEKDLFAEHASYNGWRYGTAKEDCTEACEMHFIIYIQYFITRFSICKNALKVKEKSIIDERICVCYY